MSFPAYALSRDPSYVAPSARAVSTNPPVGSAPTTVAVACFSVVAAADPGVLPQVIGVFAKRGLVPCQCYATIAGADGADLHVDLQIADLERRTRDCIAETLRQIVAVETVLTSDRQMAR